MKPGLVNGMPIVRQLSVAVLGVSLIVFCTQARATEQFESPQAAIEALVAAARGEDKQKLLEILGPDGQDVISSGDDVADKNARESFMRAYDKHNELETEGDDFVVLLLGDDDWPFPIPVVKAYNGKWEFDTEGGLEEILIRRIGRNELLAIEAAQLYVKAQENYAALNPDGGSPAAYAQRFMSSPGTKDGLYWPTETGTDESPLSKKFIEITDEGYKPDGIKPIPYRGYFFRILKSQDEGAEGGARDYVEDGRMTGGFALIAYPAAYNNSGIMTFIVNQDSEVLEKDLGEDTEEIATKIESFSPDDTWEPAQTP
ncbi:MAG: DUF2950 domain-containing protein, partial [Pseudomonadota bacterium]